MTRLLKSTALFIALAMAVFNTSNVHANFVSGQFAHTLKADDTTETEEPADDTDAEDGDATGDDSDDTATE